MWTSRLLLAGMLLASPAVAQAPNDPFPEPIPANQDVVVVNFTEFATLLDVDGEPARAMHLVDEPGSGRMFVLDMRGPIYAVSYDGGSVTRYLDVNEPRWGVNVNATGRERGVQSFAFHPQFDEPGTPGYGKLYAWTDSRNQDPTPDFVSGGGQDAHHTVLLEWTAGNATAETYDGGPPCELFRFEQPFGNHNGGQLAFNPLASPVDEDYGLLYVGVADGGSGGDPMDLAQDLTSGFGKILRIDPLGTNSRNGNYGVPADNPFAQDGDADTLGEIWAYGVRNPQRFAWDPESGRMFFSDIGQNIVEEISVATPGANLGWNDWEGSYRFVSRREVDLRNPRSDPSFTYPVAEYGQLDPLLQNQSAASGLVVYRGNDIPQLSDLVLFADNPSGEIFYVSADDLPEGGQAPIRRVLLNHDGARKTLLQVIQQRNVEQGREPARRVDLRMGEGPDGQVMLLNKADGIIRQLIR